MRLHIDSATHPEGKVYLTDILAGNSMLLRSAATASGAAPSFVYDLARRLEPLEMYFPMDSQRQHWMNDPDDDVLVVLQPKEGLPPVGFDARDGSWLTLDRESAPEGIVSFVMVPEESRRPSATSSTTGAADQFDLAASYGTSLGETYPRGLYLRRLEVDKDGEAWPRGDPEIEVVLSSVVEGDVRLRTCAHQDAAFIGNRFDMNGTTWPEPAGSEKVLIADSAAIASMEEVAEPDSGRFVFEIWEDDHERCKVFTTNNDWKSTLQEAGMVAFLLAGEIAWWEACRGSIPRPGFPEDSIKYNRYSCIIGVGFNALMYDLYANNADYWALTTGKGDDFIGVIMPADRWNEENPQDSVVDQSIVQRGSQRVGVASLAAMPSFPEVRMQGPSTVERPPEDIQSRSYYYDVDVDLTRGPVSFAWQKSSDGVSWGPEISNAQAPQVSITQESTDFYLRVSVSNEGQVAHDMMLISVVDGETPCRSRACE